jgi:TorA maturation chaperone TorD
MTPIPSNARNESVEEARAVVYRLLSRAFTYPLDQDWGLLSRSFVPLMREAAEELDVKLGKSLDRLESIWPLEPDERLLEEHTGLFINSPHGVLVPLNESVYFGTERQVNSERTQAVKEVYARAGFGPSDGYTHLLPDHLTLELEFMAVSLVNGIDAERFFNEHIYSWQPHVAKTVVEKSDHAFYIALSWILAEFLESERQRFPVC